MVGNRKLAKQSQMTSAVIRWTSEVNLDAFGFSSRNEPSCRLQLN